VGTLSFPHGMLCIASKSDPEYRSRCLSNIRSTQPRTCDRNLFLDVCGGNAHATQSDTALKRGRHRRCRPLACQA
jgi:hypothetical protein